MGVKRRGVNTYLVEQHTRASLDSSGFGRLARRHLLLSQLWMNHERAEDLQKQAAANPNGLATTNGHKKAGGVYQLDDSPNSPPLLRNEGSSLPSKPTGAALSKQKDSSLTPCDVCHERCKGKAEKQCFDLEKQYIDRVLGLEKHNILDIERM